MSVREELESREREFLLPQAAKAAESRGREYPEPEHEYRTAFQRDRDRILHTKAFRRLMHKTQVFCRPKGDHYRTRLTHTLEVSQIARTITRALKLNEDLTEAIAMGHDLGHTPFGHAGEAVLNHVLEGGFVHADQSLRLVDKLETMENRDWPGLNLTFEVRDGIANHSKGKAILVGKPARKSATLEGDVLSVSDAIAYINHDIDDAIRAGIITLEHLPRDAIAHLGKTSAARINTMVGAVIQGSSPEAIGMLPGVREATQELRGYLFKHLYPSEPIDGRIRRAKKLIEELYHHLLAHPTEESQAGDPQDSLERRTADFIAGMTDDFALETYGRYFFPVSWPVSV